MAVNNSCSSFSSKAEACQDLATDDLYHLSQSHSAMMRAIIGNNEDIEATASGSLICVMQFKKARPMILLWRCLLFGLSNLICGAPM